MAYEIVFSPRAIEDMRRLRADDRSNILGAIENHLRHQPNKLSRTRIKRLRGLREPEYRLRVDEFRVYYDLVDSTVYIHSVLAKSLTYDWLQIHGKPL
jgi:mRNA-degrading endonuclease RelE of RelBE toxin-antitoxin system